jgi:hypothetical protein
MKTFISIITFLVFSGNVLFGQITITLSPINALCNGSCNGVITMSVTGGTPPYTYLWNNAMATPTVTGLCSGTYTVTVTDATLLTATQTATITQPVMLSGSTTSTNVTCNGGNNGTATVTASGGIPPYTYLWTNSQSFNTCSNLTAGTYSVTITDVNACSHTNSVTVTQPTAIVLTSSMVSATCGSSNGSATVIVANGGVSPWDYVWSNGSSTINTASTTNTISALNAGAYSVTVTDNNGCSSTKIINVNNTGAPTISIIAHTDVTCNGGNDGSLTASVSGGTPNYTYIWNFGATTPTISGLTTGNYSVTVNDALGCMATVSAIITQPAAVTSTFTATPINCFGEICTVTYTGNASPSATYNWNFSGANIISGSGQGPYVIQWTAPGNYAISLTVSESGCTSAITTENVTNPPALILTSSQTNIFCNGMNNGTATISISGGTIPYTF